MHFTLVLHPAISESLQLTEQKQRWGLVQDIQLTMSIIIFQLIVRAQQYVSRGFSTLIPMLVSSSLTACHWRSDIKTVF